MGHVLSPDFHEGISHKVFLLVDAQAPKAMAGGV
jgi:hypothetical protein